MINKENCKELRIKRANTDWWINEKAVVGANGLTYIVYVTDMGEVHIKELDAKCSKTASRDFRLCKLNCNYADEHNAPSICILENGQIIVAYTGHYVPAIRYRITERPYDIFSFGEEMYLPSEKTVTYVQLFENTKKNELWLFTRYDYVNWQFCYSKDGGKSWSAPKTFLHSESGGLFYMNIRKQDIPTKTGEDEQWFFALYGHPRVSKDHTIRSGIFNSEGKLLHMDGREAGVDLYDVGGSQIDLETLDMVYDSPQGTTVRLLDVSPTLPYRVALDPFILDKEDAPSPEHGYYCSAVYRDGKWNVSKPICPIGEFLAKDILDGSQTYVGGMAYYYGVGEAGYYHAHIQETTAATNRIYIARFDGNDRVLEAYVTWDHGKTYELEQVIKRIPGELGIKIWRPTVPVYAQDNLPVYWHEGTYTAHTGGWHCDEVMLVEYDD